MRVDLGGPDVDVTEEGLDRAEVSPALEQMACERVAQRMGKRPVEAEPPRVAAHDRPQALPGQPRAPMVHEQRSRVPPTDQDGTTALEVRDEGPPGLAPDGHKPLAIPLPAANHELRVEVEVAGAQPDELGGPQARPVQELEECAVAELPG